MVVDLNGLVRLLPAMPASENPELSPFSAGLSMTETFSELCGWLQCAKGCNE
jgi:hypothetical protein